MPTGLSITDANGRTIEVPVSVEAEGPKAIEAYLREQSDAAADSPADDSPPPEPRAKRVRSKS
jgi:hypothetical protein